MAIEYLQTTNKPIEEPKVEGYKPQFSNDYYWNRVRKPKQENTETEPENESVSQEDTQGAQSGYIWDGRQAQKQDDDSDLDFSAKTNLGQRQVASKYLQRKLGLTKEQAAGLIGVWQAESNFNVGAENLAEKQGKNSSVKSNQYGIGIGQWTGDRHDAYMNWINTHGGKNDLKTQLDFAIDEIQNKFGDYLNNLRNAQTVKDATAYTYLQYTGGTHTGIKSLSDLYRRVSQMEAAYAKKHKELYGTSGSGNLDRRVKYAEESIFAKLGTKLPALQWGDKLGDPLTKPTALERIPFFVEMQGKMKGNQYDGPDMYDYRYGKYDPETGHWYSRDPLSGMILKNPKHPTFMLEVEAARKLGYKIYRDKRTGRLYERLPEEPLEPTFEETDY